MDHYVRTTAQCRQLDDSITWQTYHLKIKVFFVEGDGSLDIAGIENEPVQCQRHLGFPDFFRLSVYAPPFSKERTQGIDDGTA
jgi:hypothetical protein